MLIPYLSESTPLAIGDLLTVGETWGATPEIVSNIIKKSRNCPWFSNLNTSAFSNRVNQVALTLRDWMCLNWRIFTKWQTELGEEEAGIPSLEQPICWIVSTWGMMATSVLNRPSCDSASLDEGTHISIKEESGWPIIHLRALRT